MNALDRVVKASLVLAVATTVLYWSAYAGNRFVMAERRTVRAATVLPIPLNGFKPSLGPMAATTGSPATSNRETVQSDPRLLFVIKDGCPGSSTVVPLWIDWIRSSRHGNYSVVIASIEGTNYLSQIAAAFASRGTTPVILDAVQAHEFALASGVSVTPTLMALDRDGYARIISSRFSSETRRVLDEFIQLETHGASN